MYSRIVVLYLLLLSVFTTVKPLPVLETDLPTELLDQVTTNYFRDYILQGFSPNALIEAYEKYCSIGEIFETSANGFFARMSPGLAKRALDHLLSSDRHNDIKGYLVSLTFPRLSVKHQVEYAINMAINGSDLIRYVMIPGRMEMFLQSNVFVGLLVDPNIIAEYESQASSSSVDEEHENNDDLDIVGFSFLELLAPFNQHEYESELQQQEASWGRDWSPEDGIYCVITGKGAGLLLTQASLTLYSDHMARFTDVLISNWMIQVATQGTQHPDDLENLQRYLNEDVPFLSRHKWRLRSAEKSYLKGFVYEILTGIAGVYQNAEFLCLTEAPSLALFVTVLAGTEADLEALISFIHRYSTKNEFGAQEPIVMFHHRWDDILLETLEMLDTGFSECSLVKSPVAAGLEASNLIDLWKEQRDSWLYLNPIVLQTRLEFEALDQVRSYFGFDNII